MQFLLPTSVQCPACWEEFEMLVDTCEGDYETVEDCPVCCRPLQVNVRCSPGEVETVEVSPA